MGHCTFIYFQWGNKESHFANKIFDFFPAFFYLDEKKYYKQFGKKKAEIHTK